MPVDYPIPPWLQPRTDWGQLELSRSRAQAEINQNQQRLSQQAVEFNSRMEMQQMAMQAEQKAQQDQLKQQGEIAKHRMAVEQAMNQTKMQMEAQQLQEVARKVDLDYLKAAKKFAAQQRFEDTVMAKTQGGMKPEEAFRETFFEQGATAELPPGMSGAVRKSERAQDVMPTDFTTPGGAKGVMGGGRWQLTPPTKEFGETTKTDLGGGMMRLDTPGMTPRITRSIPFKFSEEKALTKLEEGLTAKYLDESADLSKLSKDTQARVLADRRKLKELLALREREREKFEASSGGVRNSERGTNQLRRRTFDPGKGSYSTNAP